jgi:glycosyltransferase involved in cell wall biosynthesis
MNIVILIPSFKNDGPIKGAFANAKLLSTKFKIYVVAIRDTYKPISVADNSKIELINLKSKNFLNKYFEYKKFLLKISQNDKTISFSMLFFPDLFNAFIDMTIISKVSSIRSNMFKNYYFDYGVIGYFYALVHYLLLRFIDTIIVMDQSMFDVVKKFTNNNVVIISNFIDEESLLKYKDYSTTRSTRNSIIYIGSLSKRKSVDKLIYSFSEILNYYPDLVLDIVGSGVELDILKQLAVNLKIDDKIIFHGQLDCPYILLSNSKIFVLPSKSEGTSRASLEALYFNIPVVLKNVDGNKYLINSNNGMIFDHYSDLTNCLYQILHCDYQRKSFLPEKYTMDFVKIQLFNLFTKL